LSRDEKTQRGGHAIIQGGTWDQRTKGYGDLAREGKAQKLAANRDTRRRTRKKRSAVGTLVVKRSFLLYGTDFRKSWAVEVGQEERTSMMSARRVKYKALPFPQEERNKKTTEGRRERSLVIVCGRVISELACLALTRREHKGIKTTNRSAEKKRQHQTKPAMQKQSF